MANQMVRKKVPPLSATAVAMLDKIVRSSDPLVAADLFNVTNSRGWGTLHILASRYFVEVENGSITATDKGRSALGVIKANEKKSAAQGKGAQRPRQRSNKRNA